MYVAIFFAQGALIPYMALFFSQARFDLSPGQVGTIVAIMPILYPQWRAKGQLPHQYALVFLISFLTWPASRSTYSWPESSWIAFMIVSVTSRSASLSS